jgi:hypothetical protein
MVSSFAALTSERMSNEPAPSRPNPQCQNISGRCDDESVDFGSCGNVTMTRLTGGQPALPRNATPVARLGSQFHLCVQHIRIMLTESRVSFRGALPDGETGGRRLRVGFRRPRP